MILVFYSRDEIKREKRKTPKRMILKNRKKLEISAGIFLQLEATAIRTQMVRVGAKTLHRQHLTEISWHSPGEMMEIEILQ